MKKSDITKQKILETAEAAFAEKGFYGARIDEIADRAGVNKRMIYVYYGSKEELYITVLNMVYSRLAQSEGKLLSEETDPVSAIRRIIQQDFEFLSENLSFVKLILWENLNEGKYLQQSEAISAKRMSIQLLHIMLRKGVDQGVFRKDLDINEVILSINMLCFSYFSNLYTMNQIMGINFEGKTEMDKRCEYVTNMILKDISA